MCPRPLRPISTKLILVIDLRWSQIKFDLPGFSSLQNPHANRQNNSIEEITSKSKQRNTFNSSQFNRLRFIQPVVNQPIAPQGPDPPDTLCLQTASTSGFGTLPGNTVTNPKEDLKGITTQSGATIQGPKAVNHDAEVTKDTMPPANNGSTEDVQPPVVQIQTRNPNPEPMLLLLLLQFLKHQFHFHHEEMMKGARNKANVQIEEIICIL
ncbi:hypothetical protein Tco_0911753 [Tanacetum coccineum]|uniref:Reverse transcriptase domain-containing protein n=1 Tax=Tanacetum coccineum TaxID=301880 RepID=A0ABQ5CXN7_9ASTR